MHMSCLRQSADRRETKAARPPVQRAEHLPGPPLAKFRRKMVGVVPEHPINGRPSQSQ